MSSILQKRMKEKIRDEITVEIKEKKINMERIHDKVREKILQSSEFQSMERDQKELHDRIFLLVSEECPSLNRIKRQNMVTEILDDIMGYGPIESLMADPDITDIMVNSPTTVFYEKNGKKYPSDISFRDEKHLRNVIERIVSGVGRRVDESSPLVDARMPDGSRVNVVVKPVALDGAALSIRRFRKQFGVKELLERDSVTQEVMDVLKDIVYNRLSIIVAGGTGTGKTTFLNALSSFIPRSERVVTVEDTSELKLEVEDWVRLETRPPNIEGKGEITAQLLVANALRMRPDRIIVGECRRGEAFDMLQAMNTGHPGSMTTIHSNSPQDTITRLEGMVLMSGYQLSLKAVHEQIASAIDIIVYLKRLRDGRRVVTDISHVTHERNRATTVNLYTYNGETLLSEEGAKETIDSMKEALL